MITTILEYLDSRTSFCDSGCHEWTGMLDSDGYGMAWWPKGERDSGKWRAHRLSYEARIGPIDPACVLHHECENRRCINPVHLSPVTPRENTMASQTAPAAINARKTHCQKGHEFTEENTARDKRGSRYCRECHREHNRRSMKKARSTATSLLVSDRKKEGW